MRTIEEYQNLIRALIAADTSCPAPACNVTTFGHLLAGLPIEQIELVQELDDTDGIIHGNRPIGN